MYLYGPTHVVYSTSEVPGVTSVTLYLSTIDYPPEGQKHINALAKLELRENRIQMWRGYNPLNNSWEFIFCEIEDDNV